MCTNCLIAIARKVFPRTWSESDGARIASLSHCDVDAMGPTISITTPPPPYSEVSRQ